MPGKESLGAVAVLIRSCISTEGREEYFAETSIVKEDFQPFEACPFQGEIFAVDGSNATVYDWSAASLNMVRAGYARGQRSPSTTYSWPIPSAMPSSLTPICRDSAFRASPCEKPS
jgi:hypothetical protein